MATTDAKPGFRLPWSADRGENGSAADASTQDPLIGDPSYHAQEHESPDMTDAAPTTTDQSVSTLEEARPEAPAPTPIATRRPNKFMAELTKAMQAAAETARADTLSRFASEAKTHIEGIQASTASEATELRKKADDDVAAIREWSKVEIARIREETDERITHRKNVVEREVETHAEGIESRIEVVQRRVATFEVEMTAFFERLLAEEDPTRFAALAESLPEPPPFDPNEMSEPVPTVGETASAVTVADLPPEALADPVSEDTTVPADRAADSTEGTAAVTQGEPAGVDAGDLFGITGEDQSAPVDPLDPRLGALGIDADFAAAEAEAADFNEGGATPDEDIRVIGDDALAARLAGLVPDVAGGATNTAATRIVVTGLISVAAIAGFKRHLSRLTGVQTVGVSSGPDGEFIFAIIHEAGLALGDSITTLPGFSARITGESDGELTVVARDPDTES